MNQFTFILKNEKIASYKKSILAIIGLNLLFFIYLSYSTNNNYIRNTAIFAIAFTLLSYLLSYFLERKNIVFSAVFTSVAFFIFSYFKLHLWWQAIAMLFILLMYLYSIRILQVIITEKIIIYPSFPNKHIQWEMLNNLLVKDNLLTIDFKNNKLIQSEIIVEKKDEIDDEKEFNDFCRQQLNKWV